MKQAAARRDFRPVTLPCQVALGVTNTLREIDSRNVIAKVEGADPRLKNEYIVYTAHWDHLGRDPKLPGEKVYSGAVDNASGSAALLELAQAFRRAEPKPKRTVLFLSVTAEEKGLLGSKYYAEHPLYPLERTLANINIDGINVWGRTRDVEVVGVGQSTLEDTLQGLAEGQGRRRSRRPRRRKASISGRTILSSPKRVCRRFTLKPAWISSDGPPVTGCRSGIIT